jgi:hypothetical protein
MIKACLSFQMPLNPPFEKGEAQLLLARRPFVKGGRGGSSSTCRMKTFLPDNRIGLARPFMVATEEGGVLRLAGQGVCRNGPGCVRIDDRHVGNRARTARVPRSKPRIRCRLDAMVFNQLRSRVNTPSLTSFREKGREVSRPMMPFRPQANSTSFSSRWWGHGRWRCSRWCRPADRP